VALFSTLGANAITSRLSTHADAFTAAAARYSVAVELLYALAAHESDGRATAVGPTDDYGLMQITGSTYRAYYGPNVNVNDLLTNPSLNVDIGAHLISDNIKRTNGDVLWAISAYNRGWGNYGGQAVTNGRLSNGVFPNQSYVDDVVRWVAYFRTQAGKPTAVTAENLTEAGVGGVIPIIILIGMVIGGLILARAK
jgi:soluble lytic murein transglycosylase-like protein